MPISNSFPIPFPCMGRYNDVENIVRGTNASEHDEKDLATVFCKSKSGAPYTGGVQGNTSDLESEIDQMVANAKATQ